MIGIIAGTCQEPTTVYHQQIFALLQQAEADKDSSLQIHVKVNAMLSLCSTKYHAMKPYPLFN
jgi:aspartate/glutamate racemase